MSRSDSRRGCYFFRRQSPVIEVGPLDSTRQVLVPSRRAVTHAKDDLRFLSLEYERAAALIGLAVWKAVSIAGDRAVRGIDDGHVHRAVFGQLFLWPFKRLRTGEEVAAGEPLLRLLFGKDDGIEVRAVERLNRDDAPSLLLQIRESDPGFQRFLF